MAKPAEVGGQIGGFFGGLFQPIAAIGKDLAGTTTTTEVTGQDESAASAKRTGVIIIAVLGVITLVAVAVYLFKNKS